MESAKERKRNALHKTIAIAMTLVFHIALFAGIYYAMESSNDKIEIVDQEQDHQKGKKQERS